MMVKVALMEIGKDAAASFEKALKLLGGIADLNTPKREVLYKLGVFDPRQEAYTTIPVARAVVNNFPRAPKIWLIESDNYRGIGSERLQIWKDLFTERVVPFNLSEDTNTRNVDIAGEEMALSHLLFEDRVLISSHILRRYSRGSVIKNLFGLLPMRKKAVYHKNLESVVLSLFEAVGGIDLAAIDGTSVLPTPAAKKENRIPLNLFLVGRDAVAVDAVAFALLDTDPLKSKMLKMAGEQGLGEAHLEKIDIVGKDLEEIRDFIREKVKGKKKKPN
ncbi:MAG: DUF362 domain-containing protein [Promethearchaeota archaeon]